ncbi:ATP-binding cassette domain-containing protein [Pedobacter sp. HMF7647]|uniref:ATP-binding cassette domain-containing protein n=1 Tax=Hufsiella arboris TaxID=2695275 RepID=A0A7K1Y574_9SPHI|nr:ATP-binding cassette domain-containing protein [Hufsiella arboris]MXV49735.1 ATP-binding cassette domain-containing protein [Hufsiella arboris]
MEIVLENIGRRFNREWIFRGISQTFIQGDSYAILGPNGSGKSTFLQVLSGSLSESEGKITYRRNDVEISTDHIFHSLSIAAPYLELIEEFTLSELIDFHFKFKAYVPGFDRGRLIELLGFERAKNKNIRFFSSGMKQRTKLALAMASDTPVLLLDEPTSNLDKEGLKWYHMLIQQFTANRLLIICSNQENEYDFCGSCLNIADYK